jgi:hypothetical protein
MLMVVDSCVAKTLDVTGFTARDGVSASGSSPRLMIFAV